MSKLILFGWISLLLSLGTWFLGTAAEPDPLAPLDEALKSASLFEYGKDSAALELVEQIVIASAQKPEMRSRVEERILSVLSEPSTRDGKEFACRQLFTIGTARSIPALEALLTDPSLSHMARYALGRNENPGAAAALHRALNKTSGVLQAGLLNTLGERRYQPAIPDIAKLLRSPDVDVAEAAAIALGKIAGSDSVAALEAAQGRAHEPVRSRVDHALLACADRFLAEGQRASAERLYDAFYAPDQPRNLRTAALRGLLQARQEAALPLLVEAIQGSDADLKAAAIGFSLLSKGPETTKQLVSLLPGIPAPAQVCLLNALAERADKSALLAVINAAKSPNESVSSAACEALGKLGDKSTVELLIGKASSASAREQSLARASLAQLSDPGVNPALQSILKTGSRQAKIEAVRALASRGARDSVSEILSAVRDADPQVRLEAIRASASLVDERTLNQLVEVALNFKDGADLAAIEEAIASVLRRVPNPQTETPVLVNAMHRASVQSKPTIVRLLSLAGTPEALQAVRSALTNQDLAIQDAAYRSLADWPSPAPAEDLLSVLQSTNSATRKVVALRGYVRMAALVPDPASMYARALATAERPADKKLVLGSLGHADPNKVLPLVEDCLKEDQLRPEASLAMIELADRLRETDALKAKAAIKKVLAVTNDSQLRQAALDCLQRIEPREGHIVEWLLAGPYREKNKDAHALFDTVFPPEQVNAGTVKWKRPNKGVGSWDINLAEALGGEEDAVAYAKTRVWSPAEQEVRLEMGSDDGIKVWLNGQVVHANNTERGLTPRQDIAKATLKEGWNDLVVKVTNRGDGWAFSCRIRQMDGTALENTRVQADP